MRIHFLQHVPYEGLGSLRDWIELGDHEVSCTRLYAGDGLPRPDAIDLLIVMGGPMGIYDEADFPWLIPEKRFLDAVLLQNTRILGVCLGAQLLADRLGARVYANAHKEIGWFPVFRTDAATTVLGGCLPREFTPFHWHGDTFDIPDGATHLAYSQPCRNQAFLYQERILGLQFHLEMTAAGARDLIDSNAGELIPAPYIQTGETMLAEADYFRAAQTLLFQLMDNFTRRVPAQA